MYFPSFLNFVPFSLVRVPRLTSLAADCRSTAMLSCSNPFLRPHPTLHNSCGITQAYSDLQPTHQRQNFISTHSSKSISYDFTLFRATRVWTQTTDKVTSYAESPFKATRPFTFLLLRTPIIKPSCHLRHGSHTPSVWTWYRSFSQSVHSPTYDNTSTSLK